MNTTIDAALSEIRRRAPLFINSTTRQKIGGQEQNMGFGDDHLFALELPAWTLRALVAANQPDTLIGRDST